MQEAEEASKEADAEAGRSFVGERVGKQKKQYMRLEISLTLSKAGRFVVCTAQVPCTVYGILYVLYGMSPHRSFDNLVLSTTKHDDSPPSRDVHRSVH